MVYNRVISWSNGYKETSVSEIQALQNSSWIMMLHSPYSRRQYALSRWFLVWKIDEEEEEEVEEVEADVPANFKGCKQFRLFLLELAMKIVNLTS